MKAAVIGGAGYAGGELLRLLLSHPEVEVTQVTSERLGGKFVHTVHPHLRRRTELKFQSRASLQPVDVLFIALPHGETSKEIDQLQTLAPTIIDLSADFRLRDRAVTRRGMAGSTRSRRCLATSSTHFPSSTASRSAAPIGWPRAAAWRPRPFSASIRSLAPGWSMPRCRS